MEQTNERNRMEQMKKSLLQFTKTQYTIKKTRYFNNHCTIGE